MSAPDPAAQQSATAADWEQRYREGTTPWDLGGPPPALLRVLERLGPARARRVLVPGAGLGHDAFAFARAGYRVTAVDLAPSACAEMRARAQRAGLLIEVVEADVLALPEAFQGLFDLVWEQTCLCALPPERRTDYATALRRALRPEGELSALLWNHGQPGGPPYDIPPALARSVFLGPFTETTFELVPPSPAGRRAEFLLVLRPA